jgi:transposase
VENAVLVVERWILAALRHRTFYTLDELNEAIDVLLKRLNERSFKKLSGSRRSLFEDMEKPVLRPLPAEPYEYAQWKKARVNIDYHIELDHCYYSVPYKLLREELLARLTVMTVEIFHQGVRVASHRRSHRKGAVSTLKEHMPPKHARMVEWTPERLLRWAAKIGPRTSAIIQGIMDRKAHPQQGFRACLGVLTLARKYGGVKLEAACQRAEEHRAFSCRSIRSILENGLYRLQNAPAAIHRSPVTHENVRGAAYYRTIDERSQPVAISANS